jgi:hypothetical protein
VQWEHEHRHHERNEPGQRALRVSRNTTLSPGRSVGEWA